MDTYALKTIRVHNWKWSRAKAIKFVQHYIDLISAKYPLGIEDSKNENYFVLPGFEHVTKNQPILAYKVDGWELTTANLFIEPETEK